MRLLLRARTTYPTDPDDLFKVSSEEWNATFDTCFINHVNSMVLHVAAVRSVRDKSTNY